MMGISSNDLILGAPLIIIGIGALIMLCLEVFLKPGWSKEFFACFILLAALVSAAFTIDRFQPGATAFNGLLFADPFAAFFNVLMIAGSILAVMLGGSKITEEGIEASGEYYALLLMSTAGAIIFASAAELITLFLGLETMSMALYCLCGSALSLRRSSESALKYFLLGSFSSAFLLYGIALLYGLTGSTFIMQIATMITGAERTLMFFSLGLIVVGFAFKIGAVPFHFWAPDVYEGAPTPVTAYMACVIKASAVAAALRVLWTALLELKVFWSGVIWYIAVLTILFGNLVALRQRSLKRMLAYSSIAHAGYMLVGFLAPSDEFGGGAAILYYLVAYTLMTMGAFGVVLAVTSRHSSHHHPDDISRFNGLGFREPFLGAAMSVFMLSLAGIPPGMAGLLGKVYIFSAAVKAEYVGLAIIGVLGSAISCYYYLRVIVAMYFIEGPEKSDGGANQPPLPLSISGTLTLCAVAVVLCGVFPARLHDGAVAIMKMF